MNQYSLNKENTGLIVIDVQEKLFPFVDRPVQVMSAMQKMIRGFQVFDRPIFITEQYPQGLGPTVAGIKGLFTEKEYLPKTTFSCCGDPKLMKVLQDSGVTEWVLIGIEAHVCVLQTAKDLLSKGFSVTVLNDAISSRSIFDFSTAIGEMRDAGIRVSSSETVLFELCRDSQCAEFKQISKLIKEALCGTSCSLS